MYYEDRPSKFKDHFNHNIIAPVIKRFGTVLYTDAQCHRSTTAFIESGVNPDQLVICEYNPDTYKILRKTLRRITVYNTDIFDKILDIDPTYLYLDLLVSEIPKYGLKVLYKWLMNVKDRHLFITISGRGQTSTKSRYDNLCRSLNNFGYKPRYVYGYPGQNGTIMIFMYFCVHNREIIIRPHKVIDTLSDGDLIVKYYGFNWCEIMSTTYYKKLKNITCIDKKQLSSKIMELYKIMDDQYYYSSSEEETKECPQIFDNIRFCVSIKTHVGRPSKLKSSIEDTITQHGGCSTTNISKSETNFIIADPNKFYCVDTIWKHTRKPKSGMCIWVTPEFIDKCIDSNRLLTKEEMSDYIITNDRLTDLYNNHNHYEPPKNKRKRREYTPVRSHKQPRFTKNKRKRHEDTSISSYKKLSITESKNIVFEVSYKEYITTVIIDPSELTLLTLTRYIMNKFSELGVLDVTPEKIKIHNMYSI